MRNLIRILVFAWAGCLLSDVNAQVVLKTDSVSVDCNSQDTILIPVRVFNFTNVGSFQFTLSWNPSFLQYKYTTALSPVFLGPNVNFGFDKTTFINQGKLTFAWTRFGGGTVADSSVVFSVAFVRQGGPYSQVAITGSPVSIEILDKDGFELPFMVMSGGIAPIDTAAPAIQCPANVSLQVSGPAQVVGIAPVSISDNCSSQSLGWKSVGASPYNQPTDGDASGEVFNPGISTVTYTVTDVGGNTANCSFSVNLELAPGNDTLTLLAGSASAGCGQTVSIDITSLNFDSLGSLQFSLGWDPAVLDFVSVGSFNPLLQLSQANFGQTFVDNGQLAFNWTTGAFWGTTVPNGAVLFRLTFTVVGGGNSNSNVNFTDMPSVREAYTSAIQPPQEVSANYFGGFVQVSDGQPPVLVCPANVTVMAAQGSVNEVVNNLQPQKLTDNCGGPISLKWVRTGATTGMGTGPANGLYNAINTTVTYTATDQSGNSSTCSFRVTVDAGQPVSVILDSVAVDCQSLQDTFQVDVTVENFPDILGLQFQIEWDPATLEFIKVDSIYPGLDLTAGNFLGFNTTPSGILQFLAGNAITGWPDIPDGGVFFTLFFRVATPGASSFLRFAGPYDAVNGSFTSVPVNPVDGFFSSSADQTPPLFTVCPVDTVVVADASCTAVVVLAQPEAQDACGQVGPIMPSKTDSLFAVGSTNVVYTATDDSGNTAICLVTVTVQDNQGPQIQNCPSQVVVDAPGQACAAPAFWQEPTGVDGCSQTTLPVTSTLAPGDTFSIGQTQVLYFTFDQSGNSDTCQFTVLVRDTVSPQIVCPQDTVLFTASMTGCFALLDTLTALISDNCDPLPELGSDLLLTDTLAEGTRVVVLTATDQFGNTATCQFNVTVEDNKPPVLSVCPADITISTLPDTCGNFPDWIEPTANDNCDGAVFTPVGNFQPGDFFPIGTTQVLYTVADSANNTASCAFSVTILDNIEPALAGCPADLVITLPGTACETTVDWTPPTATDNCDQVTLDFNVLPGSVFPAGDSLVVYTATDGAGNTRTCSFTVRLDDKVAPVFVGCPDTLVVNSPDACGAVVQVPVPLVSDNCTPFGNLSIVSSYTPGDTFPVGTTIVTITATDAGANVGVCSLLVIVNGSQPAFVGGPSDTLFYTGCSALVMWTPPTPQGFCGTPAVISNYQPNTVFQPGVYTVTYQATDQQGSTVSTSFVVVVTDPEPPSIVCPQATVTVNTGGQVLESGGIVVSADTLAGCDGARIFFNLPEASDNCGPASVTQLLPGISSGGAFPLGSQVLQFQATDAGGNTVSCSVAVLVAPLSAPVIQADPFPSCFGENVVLTTDTIPGATYAWTGPNQNYDVQSFTILLSLGNSGLYTVQADVDGCLTPADSFLLVGAAAPVANADVVALQYDSANVFSILTNDQFDANDFTLTLTGAPQTLQDLGGGLYQYVATNQSQTAIFTYELCSVACPDLCDTALVTLQAQNVVCDDIPNIFTPNRDESNSKFVISCLDSGRFGQNSLVVYNQWGDKVYEASPYSNNPGWDGTLDGDSGKPLPDGVYYYIFKPGPNEPPKKGFVQIFR